MYGPNLIDVPVKSYMELLFKEVSLLYRLAQIDFLMMVECLN